MRTLGARLALCVLMRSAGSPLVSSAPVVTGRVWPSAGVAPSDVAVEAYVQPDEDNRELSIIVDSGAFYASSSISLNGTQAARSTRVVFRMLPAGRYDVRVTLRGATGPRGSFERTVQLVAPNGADASM